MNNNCMLFTYLWSVDIRLRALSHGDTAVSPPPSPSLGAPRYKLADHRYGREEMLALFDKMMKAPDDLVIAPPLYVEKTQLPLALVQMTDEEMVCLILVCNLLLFCIFSVKYLRNHSNTMESYGLSF